MKKEKRRNKEDKDISYNIFKYILSYIKKNLKNFFSRYK